MTYPRTRLGILLLATGFSSGCDWFPPGENGDSSPTLPALTSFPDEICDGKDNNQDGRVDEGFDLDGDMALSAELCPGLGRDCDDHDPGFAPNAKEPFGTPTDYNCDGKVVLRAPLETGLPLTHVTIPGMAPAIAEGVAPLGAPFKRLSLAEVRVVGHEVFLNYLRG